MLRRDTIFIITLLLSLGGQLNAAIEKIGSSKNIAGPMTFIADRETGDITETITALFGYNGSGQGQNLTVVLDYGFTRVAVNQAQNTNTSGLLCRGAQVDGCQVQNQTTEQKCAFDQDLSCRQADTFLRFEDQNNVQSSSGLSHGSLEVDLVQGSGLSRGVLGLSPRSPFWSFVQQSYNFDAGKDSLMVSLYYVNNDKVNNTELNINRFNFTGSKLVFNGKGASSQPAFHQFDLQNSQYDYFRFEAADVTLANLDSMRLSVCVVNTENQLLLLNKNDLIFFTTKVSQQLCGKSACEYSDNLNFEAVSDIQFSIFDDDNKVIYTSEFKARDFIYKNDESLSLEIKFGALDTRACGQNAIGVGRLFLLKNEFVVQVKEDSFMIGFNQSVPHSEDIFLMVLGGIGSIILLAIVCLCCNRGSSKKPVKAKKRVTRSGRVTTDQEGLTTNYNSMAP